MSFYIICCFFVIQIITQTLVFGESNEKDELLEWYYKQSKHPVNRISRQVDNNYDYDNDNNENSNNDEDDDWYVFDRVDNSRVNNNARNFDAPWQNNPNQVNQNNNRPFWMNRPSAIIPSPASSTPQPTIPNAGPPRLPPCEENCNARTTSEYNPVCGTNGVTYFNNARFECAQFCGRNIVLRNRGRCGPLLPRI